MHEDKLLASDSLPDGISKGIDSPLKSICLNVSHDCQLKCKYCFASYGKFGGTRKMMSTRTACKAIDLLVLKSGNRKNLEVDFFGGEPLMNFEVMRQTVGYARKLEKISGKEFKFTVTTNGIALDDKKTDFINREMSNVVLSLDGRKEINDSMRVSASGAGSYDLVLSKFKKLVEKRGNRNYYIRGTFTRNNTDFCRDVMSIYDLGFKNISIEPAVLEKSVDFSIENADPEKIFSEYEKLAEKIIKLRRSGSEVVFFHFAIDLNRGPCAIKRAKGCGRGIEYVAVTPEGDIYPCHQFIGSDEFKMGSVEGMSDLLYSSDYDKILQNVLPDNSGEKFRKPNIYANPECKKCWAKFYCGGGCSANNWNFNKNLNMPHKISCELEKKRIECAIMIECVLHQEVKNN
jgi:uncharacterized protein